MLLIVPQRLRDRLNRHPLCRQAGAGSRRSRPTATTLRIIRRTPSLTVLPAGSPTCWLSRRQTGNWRRPRPGMTRHSWKRLPCRLMVRRSAAMNTCCKSTRTGRTLSICSINCRGRTRRVDNRSRRCQPLSNCWHRIRTVTHGSLPIPCFGGESSCSVKVITLKRGKPTRRWLIWVHLYRPMSRHSTSSAGACSSRSATQPPCRCCFHSLT